MTHKLHLLNRRSVITGVLSAAGTSVLAVTPNASERPRQRPNLQKLVSPGAKVRSSDSERLVQAAKLGGAVGFAVADVRTGKILDARMGGVALPPASTLKVVTALFAIDRLGGNHQFQTRVLATGPLVNGRLEGDLILAGGGDPTMDSDRLAELAKALREAGVTEVAGRFLLWAGALPRGKRIDAEQPDHVAYNPSYGGLNLNFNRVHFQWRKQKEDYDITMHARSRNYSPATDVAQMTIAERKSPVFEYRDWGHRDQWSVADWALGKDGARWLPVRYPALYAGDVFRTLARSNGIVLKPGEIATVLPEARELVSVSSDGLVPMVQNMLKFSTNLTAECTGMAASRTFGNVDTLEASGACMGGWCMANFGVAGMRFMDHSGLGYASQISPSGMTNILAANAGIAPLLKTVNLATSDTPLPKGMLVRAKTGTLNFVSSLAGIVTNQNGRDLAFAIFTADTERRDAVPKAQRERPSGSRSWANRSRRLQRQLLREWTSQFG
ncbi:D-alanyl-D-alanine carboxypeptidase/D-alanyl-D-alanine-endopeptidase [Rhodobacteraceae bacterium]|nr:D-alanyl-D-alanine carboxypeptidase/D-alanyl-D-alanine-endopeptidase [Paracoccaceae bacterium]